MKARMFEVKINLGNEEMQNPAHVRSALMELARKLCYLDAEFDGDHGPIMDVNGNKVGSWRVI